MEALDAVEAGLDTAQDELTTAELALCEAKARAEAARTAHTRLVSAVAALKGESPSAIEANGAESLETTPIDPPTTPKRADAADMSPEEFDKQRRKRLRAKEAEEKANNPLGHVKCPGCGTEGSMQEQMIQTPSGMPLRMLVCGKCNNQLMS